MNLINPNFAGYLLTILSICIFISIAISVFFIPIIVQNLDKINFNGYSEEASLKQHIRGYFLGNDYFLFQLSASLLTCVAIAIVFMLPNEKINLLWVSYLLGTVFNIVALTIYIIWHTFNKTNKILINKDKLDIVLDWIKKTSKKNPENINKIYDVFATLINEPNSAYQFERYNKLINDIKEYFIAKSNSATITKPHADAFIKLYSELSKKYTQYDAIIAVEISKLSLNK